MGGAKPTEKARSWIEGQLRALRPGSRLPPDEELARTLGVSRKTVGRLMKPFAERGLVVRIPGSGTYLPTPGAEDAPPAGVHFPRSSAQRLRDTIFSFIRSGRMKRGEALPSVKYMSLQFRMSRRTVVAAYHQLVSEGHVEKIGRNFWVGGLRRLAVASTKKDVLLVFGGDQDFGEFFLHDPLMPAYRTMEDVLAASGFVLHFEHLDRFAGLYEGWTRRKRFPYGLALYRFDGAQMEKALPTLAAMLSHKGLACPPLVLDWTMGFFARMPKKLHILSRPNISTAMARALARFFVNGGCQALNMYIDEQETFSTGKSMWRIYDFMRLRAEMTNLDSTCSFRFIVVSPGRATSRKSLCAAIDREIADRLLSKYAPTLFPSIEHEMFVAPSIPEACAKHPGAEAWLFQKDVHAAQALSWAGAHGVRVPEDVSMICLEDNPAHYRLGISRCEPDAEAIGYLMAHVIIGDFAVEKTTKGFIRVGAKIVEKLTTS